MTMPTIKMPVPFRIARRAGTCPATGCRGPIWPGHIVVKRPAGAWVHLDCANPGKRSRIRA